MNLRINTQRSERPHYVAACRPNTPLAALPAPLRRHQALRLGRARVVRNGRASIISRNAKLSAVPRRYYGGSSTSIVEGSIVLAGWPS